MAKKIKNTETIEKKTEMISTVYIGPSLPGLSQYKTFKGGILPEYILRMIEKNEVISSLIVPVTQLQEARENIKKQGHILNYYAQKLKKGV